MKLTEDELERMKLGENELEGMKLGEDEPLDDCEEAEGGEAEDEDQQQEEQPLQHLARCNSEMLVIFVTFSVFVLLG